jgi:hypothetical protein
MSLLFYYMYLSLESYRPNRLKVSWSRLALQTSAFVAPLKPGLFCLITALHPIHVVGLLILIAPITLPVSRHNPET